MSIVSVIYRIAIAFWTGGIAIFTFAVTPLIFKNFGRDLAGQIVGAVFPAYFRWGIVCGCIALLCTLFLRGRLFVVTLVLLLFMLSTTLFQAFYIEPRAAVLKTKIASFETTPKEDPLRREFSRLHGISAACNLSLIHI
jgi:putative copper export protein